MKIAILGTGSVGDALADGFLNAGHAVVRGTREPAKLAAWKERSGPNGSVGTFEEAARAGEAVVMAVKGVAAEAVVKGCAKALAGKTVMDATNPIAEKPPTEGVLHFFTGPDESLLERLQKLAPEARFVKAFSCVGSALMVHPKFPLKPTMFICGADASAKAQVRSFLDAFGWETKDMGGPAAARTIEPLARLWCIPGFRDNRWGHAFKLLES
jgi:hypothetical protein